MSLLRLALLLVLLALSPLAWTDTRLHRPTAAVPVAAPSDTAIRRYLAVMHGVGPGCASTCST